MSNTHENLCKKQYNIVLMSLEHTHVVHCKKNIFQLHCIILGLNPGTWTDFFIKFKENNTLLIIIIFKATWDNKYGGVSFNYKFFFISVFNYENFPL